MAAQSLAAVDPVAALVMQCRPAEGMPEGVVRLSLVARLFAAAECLEEEEEVVPALDMSKAV